MVKFLGRGLYLGMFDLADVTQAYYCREHIPPPGSSNINTVEIANLGRGHEGNIYCDAGKPR